MVLSSPGTENLVNPGIVESKTGIEPAPSAWKADMLTVEHHSDIFNAQAGIFTLHEIP